MNPILILTNSIGGLYSFRKGSGEGRERWYGLYGFQLHIEKKHIFAADNGFRKLLNWRTER